MKEYFSDILDNLKRAIKLMRKLSIHEVDILYILVIKSQSNTKTYILLHILINELQLIPHSFHKKKKNIVQLDVDMCNSLTIKLEIYAFNRNKIAKSLRNITTPKFSIGSKGHAKSVTQQFRTAREVKAP